MPDPSNGMNSMNRTVNPVCLANIAKFTISSSFHPLIMTVFTFTFNPASLAAYIAFRTSSSPCTPLIALNLSSLNVSKLTFMLPSPASLS